MYNLIISNTISFSILTYIGLGLLKKRNIHKHYFVFFYIIFSLFTTLCTYISISSVSTLILTISYLLYLITLFHGSLKRFALIFLYFISASAVAEITAANLVNLMFTLGPEDINTARYTVAIIISGVLSFTMSKLFVDIFKSYDLKILPKYTYLILILPITTMALILDVQMYFDIIKYNVIFIFVLLGLLISNYITISVFLKFANATKAEKELLKVKKENELSNAKYELLNNQFNTNYYFLHDTVRSLMKLINSNLNNSDIKKELYDLINKLVKGLNIINTNSTIVSPILNYKLSEILENKIDLKTVIEHNDFTFIDTYTQRELFSILLNMAIEQCKNLKSENRLVILKTKKIGQQVIIQLLFTHSEFSNYTRQLYIKLEKNVKLAKGTLSYHPLYFNNENDSLIIVFYE